MSPPPLDFARERAAGADEGRLVVGVDEAGRGPWAGPVVAAAVLVEPARLPPALRARLADSKALAPELRAEIAAALEAEARIALGRAEAVEVDARNVLQASLAAMARAVTALGLRPDLALVDGNRAPEIACPVECVVGGDAAVFSIAAASIVAKVARDREMEALAARHPGYGWERNRGYGTPEHRRALIALGPSPQHRRSFRPVRELLQATLSR